MKLIHQYEGSVFKKRMHLCKTYRMGFSIISPYKLNKLPKPHQSRLKIFHLILLLLGKATILEPCNAF